jgi:hypothetical protein
MGNTSRTLFQFGKKSKKKSVDIISFAKKNKIPLGIAAGILSSVGLGYYIKNRKPSEEQLFKDYVEMDIYDFEKKYPYLSRKDIYEIQLLYRIIYKYSLLYQMYIHEQENEKKLRQYGLQSLKEEINKKGYGKTLDDTNGDIVLYKLRKLIKKAVLKLESSGYAVQELADSAEVVLTRSLNEISNLEKELEGVKKMSLKNFKSNYPTFFVYDD